MLTTWFASKHIKKWVTDSIYLIAKAAESYVKTRKEGAETSCFSNLQIQTGDELENLSHVMADMEKSLTKHEKQIRTITAKTERINTELQMASRIQEGMLPHEFPPFPQIKALDLYATEYKEYTIDLKPGNKLFIYTDGVPEATDAHEEMFGIDRMMETLNQKPDASPEDTLRNVHEAVNLFVAGAEQFDDLTMLCLEYKGV